MKYDGVQTPPKPVTPKRQFFRCVTAAFALGTLNEMFTPRDQYYLDFWITTLPRVIGMAGASLLFPFMIQGFVAIWDLIVKTPHRAELRPIYIPTFWVVWCLLFASAVLRWFGRIP